jgi:predicted PurR-regulated permease PerM
VSLLCRAGLRQSIAVGLVAILCFSALGGMVWGFGSQLTALVAELPDYRENIRQKVVDLRNAESGSSLQRIRRAWSELRGELRNASTNTNGVVTAAADTNTAAPAEPPEEEPVPVVVRGGADGLINLPTALGPVAEVAATSALVVILVIFMLLRGRELRNRLILFCGQNRIPTTTRALDEAAERISRYLLMQTIINSSYGTALGIGLYLLGLPYALMWGVLAALLRFIPYVGPWFGAAMPILLSLAVFDGWLSPLLVLGMVLVFELISNMLMEPMLYGSTVGVSEVALIVAVAFWTWIWGPIGLALATPLTVCLVVLGKYVPNLAFLPQLMGDEPVMSQSLEFYQRLLAMDMAEAAEIAAKHRDGAGLAEHYDALMLPALLAAKRDYKNGKLSDEGLEFVVETAEKLIAKNAPLGGPTPRADATAILGVPVEDTIDELILRMLCQILPESVRLASLSAETLSGEVMEEVAQRSPALLCIGAAIPGGNSEMRYLIKRARSKHPSLPVVLGRWGLSSERAKQDLAQTTDATEIATTLKEARNYLVQLSQLDSARVEIASAPVFQETARN